MKCVQTGVGEIPVYGEFLAGYHHPAVDDCRIEDTIPLA